MSSVTFRRAGGLARAAFAIALLATAWLSASGDFCRAADGAKLEEALLQQAPKILEALRSRGCRSAGVLKFRVLKGQGKPSDDAGTLNWLIAQRLEAALVLASSPQAGTRIQLVRDASGVAAKIRGASHLSGNGRQLLFDAQYTAAWGEAKINVDAFVTGVVQVAPDLENLQIDVLAVRRQAPELEAIARFFVQTDGAILNELGESFQLRSLPDDGDDPAARARLVKSRPQEEFPLVHKPSVSLRIFYDDRPVELTFEHGEAVIPEPREGQTVTMKLERLDRSNVVLGAVLKVNGENTLFRQRMRDLDCAKWVLKPGSPATTIRGFQSDDNRAEAFRVASREESEPLEMYYGPDVGNISLVVFQEASAPPPPDSRDEAPDLLAIAKAQFPVKPPLNQEALQAQMRIAVEGNTTRGIIAHGGEIGQRIQMEKYFWNVEPIMSAVIRYYQPTRSPLPR